MYEGIKYDINNPNFGGLGSHKRYGEKEQNEGQWWESPEAKRAQQMEIGRNLIKWDAPSNSAQDVFGSVARYGLPGDSDLSQGKPLGWLYQFMMQQAYDKKYPQGSWRTAGKLGEASPEQKKLPPPNSPEYAEYLNTGILPEKGGS